MLLEESVNISNVPYMFLFIQCVYMALQSTSNSSSTLCMCESSPAAAQMQIVYSLHMWAQWLHFHLKPIQQCIYVM